jgi:DNA-binding IclR family transcriptional regulator
MPLHPLHEGLDSPSWLSDQPQPVRVSDSVACFACPRSRTHRVITALVAAGCVRQLDDRRYQATPRLLHLASGVIARHPLLALALTNLRRVSEA